jgi:TPR repeat
MFWPGGRTAQANAANERGRKLADHGDDDAAEREYRRAVELDPESEPAWFNLGLVYKRRHDWAKCAECNERASDLLPGPGQPAWWNLGIAATALRDWNLARRAWRGYGIEIPEGEGPIAGSFGRAPIRLLPADSGEVVWCRRVDPARAVIENVPLPESGHRHGDTVLHDGTPNGERLVDGKSYPVFDEMELWQASDEPTVVARLFCPSESDARSALEILGGGEVYAEDWTATVRILCKACSEGRAHSGHDFSGGEGWRTARDFGCVGDHALVRELLARWASEALGRGIEGIERAL